ncbi:hypothetical protein O9992_28640 [Vibrio lentus]|nr:hypothetical protein [Vibrio lentus]
MKASLARRYLLNTIIGQPTRLKQQPKKKLKAHSKPDSGEDWENWIDELINAESIALGCKTIAFSYVGPEVTHPILLRRQSLGVALRSTFIKPAMQFNLELANFDGNAYATVCKALVTVERVFIPGLSPYLLALYKVMKEKKKPY